MNLNRGTCIQMLCPPPLPQSRVMLIEYLRKRIVTAQVQEFLSTFDLLTESERLEIALEILKRVMNFDFPPLSDEELTLNAEELFLELDRQEAAYE